jgi:hypothetical protein
MSRSLLVVGTAALALLWACGRGSSDTAGDGVTTMKVVGNIADWPGSVGLFDGYIVVLYNVDTGEVKRATIAAGSTGFSIEGAATGTRYNAILLDPEYRFTGILQLPGRTNTEKYYQTFRFSGAGRLGSLTTSGKVLYTSEQSDLVPDESVEFKDDDENNIPDGLEGTIVDNTENDTSSDVDGDGIPNPFDSDIDNDGVKNWLDSITGGETGSTIVDKDLPWASNPLVAAAGGTVFRHVVTEKKGSAVTLFPIFTAPPSAFSSVSIESGAFLTGANYATGGAFSGSLHDDGTNGDGVAGDGNWSIPLVLGSSKEPNEQQVIFFKVTESSGTVREYVANAGSVLTRTISVAAPVSGAITLTVGGTVSHANDVIGCQVLIYNSSGARVFTSASQAAASSFNFSTAALLNGAYSFDLRVSGPTPRNGFPGSSVRSSTAGTYTQQ